MNQPLGNSSGPNQNTKKLLYVVDDEPMLLELAKVILEPLGYDLETFRDAESALRAYSAAARRPDLLITDYAMKASNGLDLIIACRQLEPKQKVLLLSGTVDETVYSHSPVKPDRFLPKPYQARQLIQSVQSLAAV